MATIFEEMCSLPPMRVQKVLGLSSNVLVIELYSLQHKRLFLVFDPNAPMRSFHLQKEPPRGHKSLSPLILILKKYAIGRPLWFGGDDFLMKAHIHGKVEDLVLSFTFSPFAVALLRMPAQTHALPTRDTSSLSLNFSHAERYKALTAKLCAQAIFNERLKEISQTIKKKKSLLENLEKDLLKANKMLEKEHDIELIKANMHEVKKGEKYALLMDYSVTPPTPRRVDLDERLPIRVYVEQCYKKIKRAKRGISYIEPRKVQLIVEIAELKRSLLDLESKGPSVLDAGLLPSTKTPKKNKKTPKRLPYKSFISSDGITIWVGKSAKDNDSLSQHFALGNEWWFHARTAAGAHVVVKSQKDDLPSATLVEAAMLAAHFSSLKDESSPEVTYTRAKHVRKAKGLAPGKVLITHERTLFVRMDEEQLGQLLKQSSL